ncbi:hypothetical protein PHAVU_003G290400 [Phaseolus vulgaris]|uniref:Glutaredoxin domain-containing protein n=1 Tax=Phaseolus vulgaris TaxID=3885 RepID=V7CEB4_PHAVU|nr:hypothetical protein PHAVU_003G290400g [Phaseolus vulgaris]ESW28484.1 hypothetical protein PHAVU_003G290400g [Phaseolus vulgaris]
MLLWFLLFPRKSLSPQPPLTLLSLSLSMHQAPPSEAGGSTAAAHADVVKMVSENPVIVVGTQGCCMCHVVQKLLQGLGVNPPVYEVDEGEEDEVAMELSRKVVGGGRVQFPAVFVSGKYFGGLERVMAKHISGELVPILKDAGALWL